MIEVFVYGEAAGFVAGVVAGIGIWMIKTEMDDGIRWPVFKGRKKRDVGAEARQDLQFERWDLWEPEQPPRELGMRSPTQE